ncbi:hypothetical protein CDD81_4110 [Ophiocordyceps australis]|uniref:Uncharacterized protein n=1 Tax=Ophiocordyceps australis TaxID=1399860 RepID=A0A2C5XAH9_9HYPO|nr:hypothetical protein CDD81_4110 [Ophiocordyceps australis]
MAAQPTFCRLNGDMETNNPPPSISPQELRPLTLVLSSWTTEWLKPDPRRLQSLFVHIARLPKTCPPPPNASKATGATKS